MPIPQLEDTRKDLASGVSVGIPIWSSYIEARNALCDVMSQNSTKINEIIISISKSDVLQESFYFLREMDSRVTLFFATDDLTLYQNFKKLMTLANSEYFVWFCADDRHPKNFISEHLCTLESNHVLSLSSSIYDFWLYDQQTLELSPPITNPSKDWDLATLKLLGNRGMGIAPTHLWFGLWRQKALIAIWPKHEFDWLDLYLIEVTLKRKGLSINTSENLKFKAGKKSVPKKSISGKIKVTPYLIYSLKSIFSKNELSVLTKVFLALKLVQVVRLSFKFNHQMTLD